MNPVQIQVVSGPDAGKRVEVRVPGALRIGRDESCGLSLADPSVSRDHCRILVAEHEIVVEDAGSRWGLHVNGLPVERGLLRSGDVIRLGDTEVRVQQASAVARTTIAPSRAVGARRLSTSAEPAADTSSESESRSAMPGEDISLSTAPGTVAPRVRDLESLSGQTYVRYEVGPVEARTRSGVVFRARDVRTNRAVALKVYRPDFLSDDSQTKRFLRAMRTMIPVNHPHLVKLYGAGRSQGICFTAAEFIEGASARQLIQRIGIAGMLDWRKVWRIALHMAEALVFAEEKGIVHRNLQPGNILVRECDQCAKLGDLMLARAIEVRGEERITRRGEIVGDTPFLAPEQVQGDLQLDSRADQYGLGATLYALLTGRPPFQGSMAEVVQKICHKTPEPITRFHLSVLPQFEGLVLRLLAKRPDDRYASASALRSDLRKLGEHHGLTG